MNAVKQGIIACKQKIPEQILHDAFIAPWYQYNQKYNVNPISIDEHIMINVIRQRVLPDINMTHGIRTNIPMAGCRVEMIDSYSYVVFVPKEVTGGKSVIAALGVTYLNPSMGTAMQAGITGTRSMVLGATSNLANATDGSSVMSSDQVELSGENTIYVKTYNSIRSNGGLVVTLEHDENLSAIKPRSISKFKDLIVLACKAYIYNKLSLQLDIGKLHAGHELGRYREIVDSYAEADEQYEELKETKIGKILFMNDEDAMGRHIRTMLRGVGG